MSKTYGITVKIVVFFMSHKRADRWNIDSQHSVPKLISIIMIQVNTLVIGLLLLEEIKETAQNIREESKNEIQNRQDTQDNLINRNNCILTRNKFKEDSESSAINVSSVSLDQDQDFYLNKTLHKASRTNKTGSDNNFWKSSRHNFKNAFALESNSKEETKGDPSVGSFIKMTNNLRQHEKNTLSQNENLHVRKNKKTLNVNASGSNSPLSSVYGDDTKIAPKYSVHKPETAFIPPTVILRSKSPGAHASHPRLLVLQEIYLPGQEPPSMPVQVIPKRRHASVEATTRMI